MPTRKCLFPGNGRLGFLLLLCLHPAAPAFAAEPLRLSTGVGAPYGPPDRKGFLDLLVPEVFRRLGVAAEAVGYAATERAAINADKGVDDGVAMRVRGLPARLLPPPLVSTEMFMYLHKKHADLVLPAAQALRAMKADGSYRRIFEQSLQVLERR